MSDLRLCPRDFLTEFIQLYKNCPCLWKVESKDYRDQEKRNQAYELLVAKFREVEPSATREIVRNKINSLRRVHRRELLKLNKLMHSFGGEDHFKSSLWYFNQLTFLKDNDTLLESTINANENLEKSIEEIIERKCNVRKKRTKQEQDYKMSDLRHYQRTFLTEFIELYKNFPCLWKLESKDYRDREKKNQAYDLLVAKFQELEPSATKVAVKNKISSLKTAYHRELLKFKKSVHSGTSSDDLYKPSLWYFDLLTFLSNSETPKELTWVIDKDSQKKTEESNNRECLVMTEKIKQEQDFKMSKFRQCPHDFLKDFIQLYKSCPCLWNSRSKDYRDDEKKIQAYNLLIAKFREMEPSATKDTVKNKINSLKCVYRRELSKCKKSVHCGASPDSIYKPSLWYFNLLTFLDNNETTWESASSKDKNIEKGMFEGCTSTDNLDIKVCKIESMEEIDPSDSCGEQKDKNSTTQSSQDYPCVGIKQEELTLSCVSQNSEALSEEMSKFTNNKEMVSYDKTGQVVRDMGTENPDSLVCIEKCTKGKSHKCDVCGNCFSGIGNLKKHKRLHTGEKPYRCDVCNAMFSDNGSLKVHKRIHTGEKPYQCDVCGVGFSVRASLKQHKRVHTGEKPFQCDICGAKFSQSSTLNTHKKVHTGEKPYQCDVCHVGFSVKASLKQHKRIHTGERPYKCDVCCLGFCQKQKLIRHKRVHTGEKPYKCDICSAGFTQSGTLRHHKKVHAQDTS